MLMVDIYLFINTNHYIVVMEVLKLEIKGKGKKIPPAQSGEI